jgi:hypothetical protein
MLPEESARQTEPARLAERGAGADAYDVVEDASAVGVLTLLGVAPILPPFRGPSSAKRYAKLTQNGV